MCLISHLKPREEGNYGGFSRNSRSPGIGRLHFLGAGDSGVRWRCTSSVVNRLSENEEYPEHDDKCYSLNAARVPFFAEAKNTQYCMITNSILQIQNRCKFSMVNRLSENEEYLRRDHKCYSLGVARVQLFYCKRFLQEMKNAQCMIRKLYPSDLEQILP
ncbi:hypothetical protein CDAR_176201 [Caerostris darwini]|uniref:Uncharacterized protein n=1 Tax=Caerostris darwini TaxID=1538125 RepID=A0AAV4NXC6_9ARAC|nr:hypothetical protein CDAR_176201 [Caerostris darwini]